MGNRFVLLDSIRDSSFLKSNPNYPDLGLGIVDNPLFFFTTHYVPGNPTIPRQYPVKLFWLGSPAGTNDMNDVFGINVADVDPENFAPGVAPNSNNPASSWLVNPRPVLTAEQAKKDIINWFDANYPGGASGGVGNSNVGSNSQYGTLGGLGTVVGNVSGMESLDGQFWPVYDRIDDSILLYFSIKTPNENTLAIYCYKFSDTELSSPATSSEFVGGLSGEGWFGSGTIVDGQGFGLSGTGAINILSSHRFSVLSRDPLVSFGFAKGQQGAVMLYSFGVFGAGTPDHGAMVAGSIVKDVHGSPLSPASLSSAATTPTLGLDLYGVYPVDKLGSISACQPLDNVSAGFACVYNAPSERDLRATLGGGVVISAMQLRVCYFHPGAERISFGMNPLRTSQGMEIIGTCRPQFTTYPDGLPKMLYANFSFDQYLNLGYEYFSEDILSPKLQDRIVTFGMTQPIIIYSYGKRKARLKLSSPSPTNVPDPTVRFAPVRIQEYYNVDPNSKLFNFSSNGGSIVLDQKGNLFTGIVNADVTLKDLPPVSQIIVPGKFSSDAGFLIELY